MPFLYPKYEKGKGSERISELTAFVPTLTKDPRYAGLGEKIGGLVTRRLAEGARPVQRAS